MTPPQPVERPHDPLRLCIASSLKVGKEVARFHSKREGNTIVVWTDLRPPHTVGATLVVRRQPPGKATTEPKGVYDDLECVLCGFTGGEPLDAATITNLNKSYQEWAQKKRARNRYKSISTAADSATEPETP